MRIIHLFGAILLLFATPAMAKDGASEAWIVTQRSGEVQVIRSGLQPASLAVRASLSPGDLIATGSDGRAMLTRGGDYIVVSPGSRLQIPKEEQARGFTRLIQQIGTMLYKVRHTGEPHFAVETPMLAAVVKGTSFTVVVDKDRSAVQVTDGVVEVRSAAGDARRLVQGGVTVVVRRDRPQDIIEVKSGASQIPSANGSDGVVIEGSGEVPLSAITDLTDGLVREAPIVAVLASVDTPSTPVSAPVSATPQPGTAPAAPPAADAADPVVEVVEPVTEPVVEVVETVTEPVVEVVETVTEPVVDVAETATEPVVDVVETVTEPVVDVVETVTEPVVDVVETVTEPVVDVVETVTEPVVDVVETVTEPVVDVVETVTEPVVDVVETVTEPILDVVVTLPPPPPLLGL